MIVNEIPIGCPVCFMTQIQNGYVCVSDNRMVITFYCFNCDRERDQIVRLRDLPIELAGDGTCC